MSSISEIILHELSTKYDLRRSGDNWYGMQCPFCGDSGTPGAKHLYIMLSEDDEVDDFIYMNCFRISCNVDRVMTYSDAIKLGIKNKDVLEFLKKRKKNNIKAINGDYVPETKKILPLITEAPDSVLDYFKKRTNHDLRDNNLTLPLKFVSNIKTFIDINKDTIVPDDRLRYLYNNPDKVISFLNQNGTRLYVRYIEHKYKKHDKIPIIKIPKGYRHDPYIIKTISEDEIMDFDIFISEGLFDCVNSFITINKMKKGIYVASGGLKALLNTFKKMSLYYDVQYNFLKDSDVDIRYFKKIKRDYAYRFLRNINVFSNPLGKDFGDLSEKYKIKKIII